MCTDSYGDGWDGAQVTIQGVKYCDNFHHGSEMQVQVIILGGYCLEVQDDGEAGKMHCFCWSLISQKVLIYIYIYKETHYREIIIKRILICSMH